MTYRSGCTGGEQMSHRYRQSIMVRCADGIPAAFTWHEGEREVVEVLGTWRLRDRWWDAQTASDRTYYRLRCVDGLLCEIYVDAVTGRWMLDRVWD